MTVAVNKCNITKQVKGYLDALYWGAKNGSKIDAILENYIGYLNCATVKPEPCYKDDCKEFFLRYVCDLEITDITSVVKENTVTFTVNLEDINVNNLFSKQFSKQFN